VSIWGTNVGGCTGTAGATYTLGGICVGYNNVSAEPGFVQANYTVTAGTCSVTTQPSATGGVAGTGPTTVCCK